MKVNLGLVEESHRQQKWRLNKLEVENIISDGKSLVNNIYYGNERDQTDKIISFIRGDINTDESF